MLLVSGAGLFAGTLTGFIFGIPRVLSAQTALPQDNSEAAAINSGLQTNTNLERVSDWLTTIIIGLTLVNAREILHLLHSAGKILAISVEPLGAGKAVSDLAVFAPAVGIYTFLVGFLSFYILTRTKIALLFKVTEDQINPSPKAIVATRTEMFADADSDKTIFDDDGTLNAEMEEVLQYANNSLDRIDGFKNVLTWARANAMAGHVNRAITGYQRAIALDPDNVSDRLEFAKFLAKRNMVPAALDMISAADQAAGPGKQTRVEMARMFVLLYADNPQRPEEVIEIGQTLVAKFDKDPELETKKRKAQVWFYLASANGIAWRKTKREKGANEAEDELAKYRAGALKAIKNCLAPTRHYKRRLQVIWNPNNKTKSRNENELEQFFTDKDFIKLLQIEDSDTATQPV